MIALPTKIYAHGGVVLEEDICVIKIEIFSAHFRIYQPKARQHQEFCEDIPEVDETVFVMEYEHSSLSQTPIEFRIIKDVTELGRYAKMKNVEEIKAALERDNFMTADSAKTFGLIDEVVEKRS